MLVTHVNPCGPDEVFAVDEHHERFEVVGVGALRHAGDLVSGGAVMYAISELAKMAVQRRRVRA
jgi:hypothetical protein